MICCVKISGVKIVLLNLNCLLTNSNSVDLVEPLTHHLFQMTYQRLYKLSIWAVIIMLRKHLMNNKTNSNGPGLSDCFGNMFG